MCVAFQNRVAHAMGGVTIHSGGDVSVGGGDRSLSHTDVDVLFTRNQAVRWLLIDEIGMVSDGLLGALEKHLTDAAQVNRYRHRADKTSRPFGGYNVMAFGDFYQIPPIPASSAVFLPPKEAVPPKQGKTSQEKAALDLFWSSDPRVGLTHFWELAVQKRVKEDPWYSTVLQEAREGRMSDESYNFLLGMPTEHAGCWPFQGGGACCETACKTLHVTWAEMKLQGATWRSMMDMECADCRRERERRNRLLQPKDGRVVEE
eukprot:1535191-Pyramimonas_sp.AAC.1